MCRYVQVSSGDHPAIPQAGVAVLTPGRARRPAARRTRADDLGQQPVPRSRLRQERGRQRPLGDRLDVVPGPAELRGDVGQLAGSPTPRP